MTRSRMYLETMQQVYSNTSKVMIDAKGQGNLLFLPLDELMQAASNMASPESENVDGASMGRANATNTPGIPPSSGVMDSRGRVDLRSRDRESR